MTIVGRAEELSRLEMSCGWYERPVQYVAGGETRQQSVLAGLRALDAGQNDIVLVHDGARPLVSSDIIDRCIADVVEHGCAIAAIPITDTIKASDPHAFVEDTRDRTGLWAAQTPQGARYGLLIDALETAEHAGFSGTDEASALEMYGHNRVKLVLGSRENIKITTQDDLKFAERIFMKPARDTIRVGTGYDIHRFSPDRKLVLGGVEIPSERGLLGHSDADVVLHAICDALLGAAALPDIGHLFPNNDPKYAGISSLKLLTEVCERLSTAGYAVGNVDCCVIAEQPKISIYAQEMRKNIASALGTTVDRISIKATTNEGLGSLGAGEGIACHATAAIAPAR